MLDSDVIDLENDLKKSLIGDYRVMVVNASLFCFLQLFTVLSTVVTHVLLIP